MRSRVIPARALCKFSSSQPAFFTIIYNNPEPRPRGGDRAIPGARAIDY